MNSLSLKPYSLLFYMTLFTGIFISLSSNNWIGIWLGLELNMYSFIPLLLQSNLNQEKEAAVKYFLIQALASGILILSMINHQTQVSSLALLASLMIKLGLAPCHFWFPIVMTALSWQMCWILATIQKITPLMIILHIFSVLSPLLIMTIAAISSMVGGVGGLNQTQMRGILAYSSINHLGWMTASSLTTTSTTLLYFFSYILMISSIMQTLVSMQSFSSKPNFSQKYSSPSLSITLLSLGGLPPLFGFFPKLLVLYSLLSLDNIYILLTFILVFSSTISLYYYLKIIFNLTLYNPSKFLWSYLELPLKKFTPLKQSMLLMLSITTGLLIIFLIPL